MPPNYINMGVWKKEKTVLLKRALSWDVIKDFMLVNLMPLENFTVLTVNFTIVQKKPEKVKF